MSTSVGRFLDVARSQLGHREVPVNRTPFGRWYGLDGNAWCAMYVSWCADRVGALDIIPKHAYTPTGANWFRARGRFDDNPRVGDIVYFRWAGSSRIGHVGIVEAIRPDGRLVTIEGNTQAGEGGNQSDGGGVYRRVRARTFVAGYGHPAYAAQSSAAPQVHHSPAPAPAPARIAVDGRLGPATISALQRILGVPIDGELGPVTAKALQRALGVADDGVIGPQTRKALQRRLGVAADGDLGPISVRALQERLNAGRL